jgi:YD repeat-containing protein
MPRLLDISTLLTAALLVCCGALGLAAWWQWEASRNAVSGSAGVATAGAEALVAAPRPSTVLPAPDEYREMVDRPLFTVTRRPPEIVSEATAQAPVPPARTPDWKLVGTVVTAGQNHALFWDQKGRRFVRVAPGDTMEGWEVAQIDKDQVLVRQKEKEHAYLLPEF